jgi:3-hydroxyisobutyrate dehydrogenase-like beta-hydroxyacid dehydrogenase
MGWYLGYAIQIITFFLQSRAEHFKGGFMQRIGFIGIGLMGRHMAPHLLKAGHPLTVWNRTESKAQELLSGGAAWADSPKAVARDSDVLITMVTDSDASEEVSCGSNGVLDGSHEGMILIDMSSIAPEMSRSIAERARAKGVSMLDAPVTGNPKVAAAGKLGISKAGIDPQKVIDITSVGGARTGAMETRGPKMVRRNFTAGFSTHNMYKDLSSVMKLADECGVSLPATSISWDILRAAKTRGNGDMDSCSVMMILEDMARTTVESPHED